jgi:hypothetical protein
MTRPRVPSEMASVTSYLEVELSARTPPTLASPSAVITSRPWFCRLISTWKSGERLRSRSGAMAWTRRSKEMSWWA